MGSCYTCVICGISFIRYNNGLLIRGKYICPGCEEGIALASCDESAYRHYIKGLRNIWCCNNA